MRPSGKNVWRPLRYNNSTERCISSFFGHLNFLCTRTAAHLSRGCLLKRFVPPQHINSLVKKIDVDATLSKAEGLYLQIASSKRDRFDQVNEILGLPVD